MPEKKSQLVHSEKTTHTCQYFFQGHKLRGRLLLLENKFDTDMQAHELMGEEIDQMKRTSAQANECAEGYDSSDDDFPLCVLSKKKLKVESPLASAPTKTCDFQRDLREKGYAIIENILTPEEVAIAKGDFYTWANSNEQFKKLHSKISPHGIIKHLEIGHQRHAWFIRTRSKVQQVFKSLWNTNDLAVSFDGTCWIPGDPQSKRRDGIWTHTDQAPSKKGLTCYQGFVTLTDNVDRSLVVYEGSHILHESYSRQKLNEIPDKDFNKDWLLIDHAYLDSIAHTRKVLSAKAGSLVLWDSRTFHQNQYGSNPAEERIVQYVSYLPKKGCNKNMREKRQKYFNDRRTTSHWAYPVKVNGLQPRTYGNKDLVIDHSVLQKPELTDLLPEIMKLI